MEKSAVVDRIRADAQQADALHRRSRALLVSAARAGVAEGLTQREIASAIGRSQPEVARLVRFHGSSALARRLMRNRREVLAIAAQYGVGNVRVFGSVARDSDEADSDVDLLVDVTRPVGLFTLARLECELSALLSADVDVVPAAGLREHMAKSVSADAVPL